jgi:enamine deaminase RidA (YjgF/YER057c/UK114 family)
MTEVIVPGWPKPIGYANGRVANGRVLHVGGQIGWTPDGKFLVKDLVGQFAQALDNMLAVVKAAGGDASSIAAMTVYVTNMDDYRASRKELGRIWRERLGTHYPAMALVAVAALFEREAVVEIQAVAYPYDTTP